MKICFPCKNQIKCTSLSYCIKNKKSRAQKAKEGKVQVTIPKEKQKALLRDGYMCIYCGGRYILDFHHVFYKSLERIYDSTRNLANRGVILCRSCHRKVTDGNQDIDTFCRNYIKNIEKR